MIGERFGPTVYGEKGVLTQIGGKVQCHLCGRAYHSLALHVVQTHEIAPDDYRDEFGLNRGTGLVSDALAEKLRVAVIRRGLAGELFAKGADPRRGKGSVRLTLQGRRQWNPVSLLNLRRRWAARKGGDNEEAMTHGAS